MAGAGKRLGGPHLLVWLGRLAHSLDLHEMRGFCHLVTEAQKDQDFDDPKVKQSALAAHIKAEAALLVGKKGPFSTLDRKSEGRRACA